MGLGLLSAMLYAFIRPLVTQVSDFSDNFSTYLSDAKAGKGPVGGLVKRFELDRRLEENRDNIEQWFRSSLVRLGLVLVVLNRRRPTQ